MGDVAYSILNAEYERNPVLVKGDIELENAYIPDIEYMLDFCIKTTKDKYRPVALLEEMEELCDDIILEKDNFKALEMFINACELCDKYLKENIYQKLGFVYSIKVYSGLEELKNSLPSYYDEKKEIEYVCGKEELYDLDRLVKQNFIEKLKNNNE